MGGELTAAEAAARLGVKRDTLYAYVSRGLVARHLSLDGRSSLFDSEEIEALRSRRRRRRSGEIEAVVATGITRVSDEGLLIRGRDLVEMLDEGITFEAAVEWLWGSGAVAAPPSWVAPTGMLGAVAQVQAALPPKAPLVDRLRAAVATASAVDPMRYDLSPAGAHSAGRSVLLAMVGALPVVGPEPAEDGVASELWSRLGPQASTPARIAALDAALVLLVDHGLATSTFGARVAASTRADPYSLVSAGLGVLAGPLHGGASGEVHRLLGSAFEQQDAAAVVGEIQRRGGPLPGFGHSVYRVEDPRYRALAARIEAAYRDDPRLPLLHEVRDLVVERAGAVPNVDLALGALTLLADAAPESGEAVFAISRTAGWIAHGVEEYAEAPLRFRPRAHYSGPRAARSASPSEPAGP